MLGLFKHGGKDYAEIVPDAKKATLQAIVRGRVDVESVIHTDGWCGYDGLADLGFEKYYCVNHAYNKF